MTQSARDQILTSLRRGVNNPELMVDRKRQLAAFEPQPFEPAQLAARWRTELEALTGKVYGPLAPAAAVEQIIQLARQYQPPTVLAWDEADLPLPNLAAQLEAAGLAVEKIYGSAREAATRQRLEKIPLGITGALAGLADTGSIVVNSAAGRSRLASLLPLVHVALLPVAKLYPDLPTWMALQGATALAESANFTVITGPSRTADIELKLVLGVHGPGEIHAILLA